MEKKGSWQLFFISIGLLCIMFAPKTSQPYVMITGGMMIVLIGIIIFKNICSQRKERKR